MKEFWGYIPKGLKVNSPGLSDEGGIRREMEREKANVCDRIFEKENWIISDGRNEY